MNTYTILNRKREGAELTGDELHFLVNGFMSGDVADYQMSAFLMAVATRGMSAEETRILTRLFLDSGEKWNLRSRYEFLADKHSTGGVGDKVSIALAPLVGSCGVKIAMLSGRGLGHTGGTLDKLESIRGFNARLGRQDMERCLDEVGCVIATSTESVAPADRRIYALRDVTGTVESLPLITASIMSKKLALGASALLLDIKWGNGAFVRSTQDARTLASMLIDAAASSGTSVTAMITDMSQPLGKSVGNALEIVEAFDVLQKKAPSDTTALTIAQARRILVASGKFDASSAQNTIDEVIGSGEALRHAGRWIAAQGGDPDLVENPGALPQPHEKVDILAARSGYISAFDTVGTGMLAIDLGAGRRRQDDAIDHAAGILLFKKIGDEVASGEVVAQIHIGRKSLDRDTLQRRYLDLITFADDPVQPPPLILDERE